MPFTKHELDTVARAALDKRMAQANPPLVVKPAEREAVDMYDYPPVFSQKMFPVTPDRVDIDELLTELKRAAAQPGAVTKQEPEWSVKDLYKSGY